MEDDVIVVASLGEGSKVLACLGGSALESILLAGFRGAYLWRMVIVKLNDYGALRAISQCNAMLEGSAVFTIVVSRTMFVAMPPADETRCYGNFGFTGHASAVESITNKDPGLKHCTANVSKSYTLSTL